MDQAELLLIDRHSSYKTDRSAQTSNMQLPGSGGTIHPMKVVPPDRWAVVRNVCQAFVQWARPVDMT